MTNRETVEAALLLFAEPEQREQYLTMYSADVRFHGYEGLQVGIAKVKEYYERFWSAFPDAQVTADDWVESGDRLCLRHTVSGTHLGSFFGLEGTGNRISVPGISILHFADGLCVERWSVADSLTLLNQLRTGAPKEPAAKDRAR